MPLMVPQKKGERRYVVNVGAILGGACPSPGVAVYGATKAFLDSFSQALNHEYSGLGISVMVSILLHRSDGSVSIIKKYL